MRKGLVGIALLTGMLLTPISAFAASTSSPISLKSNIQVTVTPMAKPPYKANKITSSTIKPSSTSYPTSLWSITSSGTYNGSFTGVSNATGIYTNYYFLPSASNKLIVDTYVTGENSATKQYVMWLLDKTSGGGGVLSNVLNCGQSYTVTYSNLNPVHDYFVGWYAVDNYQYIDGTFDVHY